MKTLLYVGIALRWLWFLSVEHVAIAAQWVDKQFQTLAASPVGEWIASFHLLERYPFLASVGKTVWWALLWAVPLALLLLWLMRRLLPRLKKAAASVSAFFQRLHPRYAPECHYVLKIVELNPLQERAVDLGSAKSASIAQQYSAALCDGDVYLRSPERETPYHILPGKWFKLQDKLFIKLIKTNV